jgi:hypothetical protein
MNSSNASAPSESDAPGRQGCPGTVHASRGQAIRQGMWRAAKFGFVAFYAVMLAIGLILCVFVAFVPSARNFALRDLQETIDKADWVNILVGTFFWVSFGVLYGAIPGALIGGLMAAIRWRPPAESRENTSRSS